MECKIELNDLIMLFEMKIRVDEWKGLVGICNNS